MAGATIRWWGSLAALLAAAVVLLALTPPPGNADASVIDRTSAVAHGDPDASGRTAPLLIHHDGELWLQPLAVYPSALLLRSGMPAAAALRLPAMLAALASIALTCVLALIVFRDLRLAVVAGSLMLAAPALLVAGRSPGADLLMVPFVLFWCVVVLWYVEQPRPWLPAVGGFVLGASLWTQPAGVLAVPVFFAIGCALLISARRDVRACVAAGIGVAVPLLTFALWFWRHPDSYLDTFGRWAIHPAHIRNPWVGLIAFTKWDVVARRVAAYWSYLNPTFLFGGHDLFAVAMAVLIPYGLWVGVTGARARAWAMAVGGFFAAPLAAVLLDEPRNSHLALLFVPFGALLGARGMDVLLTRGLTGRVVGFAVLVFVAVGSYYTLTR